MVRGHRCAYVNAIAGSIPVSRSGNEAIAALNLVTQQAMLQEFDENEKGKF